MDLYDIKVVAYRISKRNDNKLVTDILNEQYPKEKMYLDLFTVIKVSGIHHTDELIYKLEIVIEYLKNNDRYDYELYNRLCPNTGKPDSDIIEYAENV